MAARSASCIRLPGRRQKHSGATRLPPPIAASGSFSAPLMAISLIGTVTLLLDLPPNQPHRAEIAKMMTRLSHRHRGIATALLREAERMRDRARALAAGARYRRGRRRGRTLRADGIQADRIDSGLRVQAARRPHRHDDLLEAPASSRAWLTPSTPPQSPGNRPPSGWRRRPARR